MSTSRATSLCYTEFEPGWERFRRSGRNLIARGAGIMVQADRTPTLEDLRARRAEILRIMARRGVRNIRVFGSVARGEAKPDSDIDLLVDLEPGRSALDLSELILDLEEALGRRVDVVELRRESGIAERIKRESVAL